jgi:hypothetical protein
MIANAEIDRFIGENWTVLQRPTRKYTNGHKIARRIIESESGGAGEKAYKNTPGPRGLNQPRFCLDVASILQPNRARACLEAMYRRGSFD